MSERGGIISGFLLKTVIGLVLFGAVVFEGGAIVFAKVQADSVATECADVAASEFARSGSTTKATDAADAVARRRGAELVSVEVDGTGERLTATVRVRAKTNLIHRIGSLRRHGEATATHTSRVL